MKIYCLDLWNTLVHSTGWNSAGRYEDLLVTSGAPREGVYPFVRDTLMTGQFSTYEEMVSLMLHHFNLTPTEAVRAELAARWTAENSGVAWLPEAEARLQALRELGHTVVLVTNTTRVGWEVTNQALALEPRFSRLFLSCDQGMAKPSDGVWQRLMAWFPTASPSDFVMIGDSHEDDLSVPPRFGWATIPAHEFRAGRLI